MPKSKSLLVDDIDREIMGKEQLSEAIKSVKTKYKMLTTNRKAVDEGLERVFKPVTTPLKPIAMAVEKLVKNVDPAPKEEATPEEEVEDEDEVDDEEEEVEEEQEDRVPDESGFIPGSRSASTSPTSGNIQEYLSFFDFKNTDIDHVYGVKRIGGRYYLGNKKVNFTDQYIRIDDVVYPGSAGLYELLFKKTPNPSWVHQYDINTYRRILKHTNAHRKGNLSTNPLKTSTSYKFMKYIKPLFPMRERRGMGMVVKTFTNSRRNVLYWNDPNELVDRLRLLHASMSAGHTGLRNEVIAIEEELREAGIIV